MGKGSKGRRRRKNSKNYGSDSDGSLGFYDNDDNNSNDKKADSKKDDKSHKNKSDLTFAERRDLQRKVAAEKRRQKMKCYLCGKTGHVRRECPGIADDGRGESKYTKSNGDAGAIHLKHKGRKKHSTNHNSSNNGRKAIELALPPGFDKKMNGDDLLEENPFRYYDAGYEEGQAILDYLRFGRHGHGGNGSSHNNNRHNNNTHNHTQVSRKDAISEYDLAMKGVCETTNFGGCILRSYLPVPTASTSSTDDNESWKPQDSFPFSWSEETPSLVKFVVGYPGDYETIMENGDDDDDDAVGNGNGDNKERSGISTAMVTRLVEAANNHKSDIVGLFADLDYTALETGGIQSDASDSKKKRSTRGFQLKRLRSTLKAASTIDRPVQIRILPGYKACQQSSTTTLASIDGETNTTSIAATDGYSLAIRDLGQILVETSVDSWKVHLSSWNGKAEHLVAFAGAFSHPPNLEETKQQQQRHQLVFGFNGSLGFSKSIHLHESAFEISPHQVVLETGGPGILPPVVAKHGGRNAFCHSGQIPFVAEELAKHLRKNPRNNNNNNILQEESETDGAITAEKVARWASATTKALYGLE